MTDEKRSEIIKSLALDVPASEIAANENISAAEVEQIHYDNADEINRKKEWLRQRYGA